MKVAIVKYNAGNIYSVVNAMRRLGVEPIITDEAEVLASADRVLFPGQGASVSSYCASIAKRATPTAWDYSRWR